MSGKKPNPTDKIAGKAGGASSGGGNLTEAWQKILQNESSSNDMNELLKDVPRFPEPRDTGESPYIEIFEDSSEKLLFSSRLVSASNSSIQPSPITITSELKESTHTKVREEQEMSVVLLSGCCSTKAKKQKLQFEETKERVKHSHEKVSKYFHELKPLFGRLESVLSFNSALVSSKVRNVVSAQLWFVTFALVKEICRTHDLARSDMLYFRTKYQTLLAYASHLNKIVAKFNTCLNEIETEATKQIRRMKQALTGLSTSDLRNTMVSTNDDMFVEGNSWMELTQPQLNRNKYRSASMDDRTLTHTVSYTFFQSMEVPDSLSDRRELEIFVKNVTKSGWTNYESTFNSENRMKLIRLLIAQTVGDISKTIGICEKLKKKLSTATSTKFHALLTCKNTLIPWFREITNCVRFAVKSTAFGPKEYEFMRFYIFSSEMRLQAVLTRARSMQDSVKDIAEIDTICCDLLEKKELVMLPNYDQVRPSLKYESEKLPVTADEAMSRFYLNGYANVLKEVPICFRISEFMLAKSILPQERHSGVDFGVRFLNKAEPFF